MNLFTFTARSDRNIIKLLIIEFVNLFVQRWKQLLRPSRITTRATLVTPDVQEYQLSFSSTSRLSFIASIACWLRRLLFIVSFTAYRLTFIALCLLTPVSSSLSVYG